MQRHHHCGKRATCRGRPGSVSEVAHHLGIKENDPVTRNAYLPKTLA